MTVPQFTAIDVNKNITLDTIIPTGDDTSDNVEIQLLTAGGNTAEYYTWNDWMFETPCWVDKDGNAAEGVSFAPGQGLWVMGTSSNQSVQSAGQVGMDDIVVTLRNGGTATGNPFPVAISLDTVVPTGEDTSDNVEIQILTAGGNTAEYYTWNDWMFESPCWVDKDGNVAENITFAAGQGLWVMGTSSNQGIRFTAPEL